MNKDIHTKSYKSNMKTAYSSTTKLYEPSTKSGTVFSRRKSKNKNKLENKIREQFKRYSNTAIPRKR